MKKSKIIFLKVKAFVLNIFDKADELVERIAPVAINVVEQIKTINETTTGDIIELIITKAIKGEADDLIIRNLRVKLKEKLPEVIEVMRLALNIAKVDDKNLQAKMVLDAINISPDQIKNAHYHTFCSMLIESISDGKLTWGESVIIAQYYYDNIYKPKNEQ